jgi:hypothetical protein
MPVTFTAPLDYSKPCLYAALLTIDWPVIYLILITQQSESFLVGRVAHVGTFRVLVAALQSAGVYE